MANQEGTPSISIVGRYGIHAEIARGGMATVHVGRLMGPVGFSRTVAIKRLHSIYAQDPEFVAMFMDEARLAARIQHPNVVSIIDVVAEQGELLLVMDYVQGESLSRLLRAARNRSEVVEPKIAVKILSEVLNGLHAAHEARNERGQPLGIVHRDVSPQNILVGSDGVARLIDFGVAKAAGRIQSTRDGQIKGKLAYMAPEQIRGKALDRRTDLYAAAAVLWEVLAGRRLFTGDEANLMYAVLTVPIAPPSTVNPAIPPALDAVVMQALQKNATKRFASALEFADALEAAVSPASSREVARWLERLAADALDQRANLVAEVENSSHISTFPPALAAALSEELSNPNQRAARVSVPGPPPPPPPRAAAGETEPVVLNENDLASGPEMVSETPTETSSSISSAHHAAPHRSPPVLWIAAGVFAVVTTGIGTFLLARSDGDSAPATAASATPPPMPQASEAPTTPPLEAASVAPAACVSAPEASTSPPPLPSETAPVQGSKTGVRAGTKAATAVVPTAPATGAKKKQTYTRD